MPLESLVTKPLVPSLSLGQKNVSNDNREIFEDSPLLQNAPPTAPQTEPAIKRITALWHRKGMTFASLNVNSLLFHIDVIRMFVNELGIHILALNETKLDNSIDYSLINIEGYTIKSCDRDRHGLVWLFI